MSDENSNPGSRNPIESRIHTSISTSIHSVHSTTQNCTVVRSSSFVASIHSTHSNHSVHSIHSTSTTTTSITSEEEQLHSIQMEIERVERLEQTPTARRSRAGFNSIRDALGNLRQRLSALGRDPVPPGSRGSHAGTPRGDDNDGTAANGRQERVQRHFSLVQQLSDRLHMVDVAHSARVPLQIVQRRRSQTGFVARLPNESNAPPTNDPDGPSIHVITVLEAPVFHFSVRESFASAMYDPGEENESPPPSLSSSSPARVEHRRTSLLFASRLSAHRLIMEGSANDLLASGGDGSIHASFGISSFSSSGLGSFTGRGSMRDLGRNASSSLSSSNNQAFFDLERHVHPSFSRRRRSNHNLSPLPERRGSSREESIQSDYSEECKMDIDYSEEDRTDPMREEEESNKKMKMDDTEESSERVVVAQPLLTRRSSKSLSSLNDAQHEHLSGSLYASPRKSILGLESTDMDSMSVRNENGLLYSWGWGKQSLHDDEDDRLPTSLLDTTTTAVGDQQLQVTSRLGSKAILAVSTGQHHAACATSQGTVYVVGTNLHGCLDPDLPEEQVCSRPVLLESLGQIRVVQVSCGYDHTAALSSNGSVLTWGSNSHGQLGHRITNSTMKVNPGEGPTHVRPAGMFIGKGRRVSAIACGTHFTMVLTTRRSLLVCGTPSIAGHRDSSEFGTLKELPSLVGLPLVGMSAGHAHAAVVTAHGTALVWGSNRKGACGREYPEELALPVPVKVVSDSKAGTTLPFTNWEFRKNSDGVVVKLADDVAIQHVACGYAHTILVARSGRLLVFGDNCRCQLGTTASEKPVVNAIPVYHPNGGRFVSAEAGNAHSVLLDSEGDVWMTTSTGLRCILEGQHALAIAAGGDDNAVAIASPPSGNTTLNRQFSMDSAEDGTMIVDQVESLLDEMDSDSANKVEAGQDIAKRTEELLRYPALLNSLFLNPAELDEMFERIKRGDLEIKKAIALAIERGLKFGLESLRDNSRLMYPEAVRCLLLYIIFFDIRHDHVPFDIRGDCIMTFCDTLLGLPFEGYRALHGWATSLYTSKLFVKMLVRPLLVSLNACLKFYVDENQVHHFQPSRRSVPVIIGVLSWLYTMAEEANLAVPTDFYSDGVSQIDVNLLFEDLYRMKKAGKHERSKNFYICAYPFLLSPGCKRNLLQMESQVEQYKAMIGDIKIDDISESQHRITLDPFFHLEVEREKLLEQTLEKIKQTEPKEVRKRLRVSFKGEEGLDAGGVTKEFFQLLSEDLFGANSGLWTNKYGDEINWFSSDNTWDIKSYELIGILFGLALYNSVLLDVRFPLAVYRKILGLPLGLEDIMDADIRRGLQQLLDYEGDDVEDVFCLTFEVTWMELGEEKRIELKPGGADVAVTKQNKEEYVLRYVRWLLVDSIQQQWNSFEKGVMTVMESSSLDLFLPEELELLVVGSPELDFNALEANTRYEGGYTKDSDTVINFWKFVKQADKETQIQLLKFATASSKAPIGGLGKLPFVIQRAGPDSHQLPTSHTCFNTLLLPDYGSNYDKLASCLGRAILECEGFGLE